MDSLTESPPKKSTQLLTRPSAGGTSRPTDTALAEAITTLRELETVAFQLSRNSTGDLFFAQHRLLLMRLGRGKAPSQADWLSLAALGRRTATGSEGKAA